jgi:transcriptional regulator with XRE-family HTH domain
MTDSALVSLVLKTLKCSQKELALRLGVSEGQISKWKVGEHMSLEMDERLRKLAKIKSDEDVTLVLAVGAEAAVKWRRLIAYLAEHANETGETGYVTAPLADHEEWSICENTFMALRDMGVAMPTGFPAELEFVLKNTDDADDIDAQWEAIEQDPHAGLIVKIFSALNDVWGFYAAYISHLIYDDEIRDKAEHADDIESDLVALAASKIEDVDPAVAPRFDEFVVKTEKDYRKWLLELKRCAIRLGVPLKAEIMDLVYEHHDALGHTAEVESLGFNDGQLHPDIYMNEVVTGMRMVHQMLPAILEKLGMKEDFELDRSELSLDSWRHRKAAEGKTAEAQEPQPEGSVAALKLVEPQASDQAGQDAFAAAPALVDGAGAEEPRR